MGGGSYSSDWYNSIQTKKISSSEYSQTGNSSKYAKYDNQVDKEMDNLINQYLNLEVETKSCYLHEIKYKEFIELIGILLQRIQPIDHEQFVTMQDKYNQLVQKFSHNRKLYLDKINKEHTESIAKVPILTFEPYSNEMELYVEIKNFTDWLNDILKFYGLYPEKEDSSVAPIENSSVINNPATVIMPKKLSILERIKQFFFKLFKFNTDINPDTTDTTYITYKSQTKRNTSTLQSVKQENTRNRSTAVVAKTPTSQKSKESENECERGTL